MSASSSQETSRNTYLATGVHDWRVCILFVVALLFSLEVNAESINGSIHFQDEEFKVSTRTFSDELRLTHLKCAIFTISVAMSSGDSKVLLLDNAGNEVGGFGFDEILKVDSCSADIYETRFIFDHRAIIQWTPEVDRTFGYDKVQYKSIISPTKVAFSPSIDVLIYPKEYGAEQGELVANVSSMVLIGSIDLVYRSSGVRLLTSGGSISRPDGFRSDDKFLIASNFRPFSAPDAGKGREIGFEASPDRPTRFSLYYPSGGPHVLAFFGDANQQSPTTVSDFQVDGKGLLIPEVVVTESTPFVAERGLLHFIVPRDQELYGKLRLGFGGGIYIRDVKVVSSDGRVIDFAQNLLKDIIDSASEKAEIEILNRIIPESLTMGPAGALSNFGAARAIDVVRVEELEALAISDEEATVILGRKKYAPVLEYPIISTSVPLSLSVRARVPASWDVGQRVINVSVRTYNGFERQIPIEIKVVDPYSTPRTMITGVLGTLLTTGAIWFFIERRKLAYQQREDQDKERLVFVRQHYVDYLNLRERAIQLLASTPTWAEVNELLHRFVELRLQTALSTEDWEKLRSLWDRQETTGVLMLLLRSPWIDKVRND